MRGKDSLDFLTFIYQVNRGPRRLLWIGSDRKEAALRQGFDELEGWRPGIPSRLKVVCSDMWKPYLEVVRQRCGQALNVLDPFHIVVTSADALKCAASHNIEFDSIRPREPLISAQDSRLQNFVKHRLPPPALD